jgi:hypothetical protein
MYAFPLQIGPYCAFHVCSFSIVERGGGVSVVIRLRCNVRLRMSMSLLSILMCVDQEEFASCPTSAMPSWIDILPILSTARDESIGSGSRALQNEDHSSIPGELLLKRVVDGLESLA